MRLDNIRDAWRYGLIGQRVLERLKRLGIEIVVYYLVEEGDFEGDPEWEAGFAGIDTVELGPADMPEVQATRAWIPLDRLLERLRDGHLCIGLREHGRLAAYTWADQAECNHQPNRHALAPGEAYLYEAYTLPAWRGRDLAPFMRARCYAVLRARGFGRFYSITDYFNSAAARFKQKLNARPLRLHLYLSLGGHWQRNWTLRSDLQPRAEACA